MEDHLADDWRRQLDGLLVRDRERLAPRLLRLARRRRPWPRALARQLAEACARAEARRQALPRPRFDQELPVVAARERIAAAIAQHQVVVVCGETGSGKTTQLPKICLAAGRGSHGFIGHTQPRRIAARSLALRIAAELDSPLGHAVGYRIRFTDRIGSDSYVKVMTDGILLAEIRRDPRLLAYDTLIIDEAHERSLNIDFLLGYLHRLLPSRPDLRLILTSATIDPERFARHFGGAPVIEVSGRGYPVELRYRPPAADGENEDPLQPLVEAVVELGREGPGDILVFLPGERQIREAAEALRKHHPPETELLPLYARLSAAQQQRVFAPHTGRRILLATNVAETALTVPGIRYVVDTGLARISRFSHRTKVQRLPIEPISRASADQRAGRCGREAPGICIRLYAEEDYLSRPAFTEPEILRSNLANVILQMLYLGLGDIDRFPFLDPPDPRQVRSALRLLAELGALDGRQRLTETGRRLARLPVDARLGRMLLEAAGQGALEEVLVIVAALAANDPRERPLDRAEAADACHRPFADERSDFLFFLNLWRAWREQARHLSRNQLRRWCQARFLSWMRMRDWEDIWRQLRGLVADMGLQRNEAPAGYAAIHRSLLAGLLGQVAQHKERHDYLGARGMKLQIFPGSVLFRRRPRWILAGEILETGRRYARMAAIIEPEWVEALAGHLVKRSWQDPHWAQRRGQVVAWEQVTLYGLVLASRRPVDFGAIDPAAARAIFLRDALARGALGGRLGFQVHNRALLAEVADLESRVRRPDIGVDEDWLVDFYQARLPPEVRDRRSLERWYRTASAEDKQALYLDREAVIRHSGRLPEAAAFPDALQQGGLCLPLAYRFAPGSEDDGVTVTIPLLALNRLEVWPFERLVPGLLAGKIEALIRSLPKAQRRHLVPAPRFAEAARQALVERPGPLLPLLAELFERMSGVRIEPGDWRLDRVPDHFFMRFSITDADGRILGSGRDLEALKARWGGEAQTVSLASSPGSDLERRDLRRWSCGELPERVEIEQGGLRLAAFPALVAAGEGRVDLRLLDDPAVAPGRHREGVRALFRRMEQAFVRRLERQLPERQRLCLHYAPLGGCEELVRQLVDQVLDACLFADGVPRSQQAFEAAAVAVHAEATALAGRLAGQVATALELWQGLHRQLRGRVPPAWLQAVEDMQQQLDALVYPGFVAATPIDRLSQLPRYLRAMVRRLERLQQDPVRDRRPALEAQRVSRRWRDHLAQGRPQTPGFRRYRWLTEEYRVSLFAQALGTAEPVSAQRLDRLWAEVERGG